MFRPRVGRSARAQRENCRSGNSPAAPGAVTFCGDPMGPLASHPRSGVAPRLRKSGRRISERQARFWRCRILQGLEKARSRRCPQLLLGRRISWEADGAAAGAALAFCSVRKIAWVWDFSRKGRLFPWRPPASPEQPRTDAQSQPPPHRSRLPAPKLRGRVHCRLRPPEGGTGPRSSMRLGTPCTGTDSARCARPRRAWDELRGTGWVRGSRLLSRGRGCRGTR